MPLPFAQVETRGVEQLWPSCEEQTGFWSCRGRSCCPAGRRTAFVIRQRLRKSEIHIFSHHRLQVWNRILHRRAVGYLPIYRTWPLNSRLVRALWEIFPTVSGWMDHLKDHKWWMFLFSFSEYLFTVQVNNLQKHNSAYKRNSWAAFPGVPMWLEHF